MKSLKVLAVVGLAVALVAVPALAQQAQVITVSCRPGPPVVLSANPPQVEVRIGTPIQWTFDTSLRTCAPLQVQTGTPPQPTFSVDAIKITFATTSPFDTGVITIPPPTFAASGNLVTTPSRNAQNVGSHKYKIEFLRNVAPTGQPPNLQPIPNTTIDGTATVIQVTPTLTEWGLIALAALLMGGMGYMLYRRRPALRPAAP